MPGVDEKSFGLILRTRPLTETSLIVNWLTPDLGRVSTVAKGARRHKSPFRGKLDLFYEGSFSFARSRRSELHALREVVLGDTHARLRRELDHLRQAVYAARLVEVITETETPLPEFYEFMTGFLRALPLRAPQAMTATACEIKLLALAGLEPDWLQSRLSGGASQIAAKLAGENWESVAVLRPTSAQASEIWRFLHRFMADHLQRIPQGRNAALLLKE